MYEKIDSKNYDFLWRVGGFSYLFLSFALTKEYLNSDFVIFSENDKASFFISKKQRKILSEKGFNIFNRKFDSYEKEVKKQLKASKGFFSGLDKKKIDKMPLKELAGEFEKKIHYCQKIWSQYFWSEYFCQDKVAKVIGENSKKFDLILLRKNVERMANMKYEQRKAINHTFYPRGVFVSYYKKVGKRLGLGGKIKDYHYKEIIALLRGKEIKIPDRSLYIKGKFSEWQDIFGAEAKKILGQLEKINDQIKEIKGQVGSRGYYKGKVKKIEFSAVTDYAKEINSMKRGDVLVSGSTGPEMILACKKAGAIITDEGGITSHAALVSRELGIPSVIATKIATRLLKDGDLVEVDADKGVVRILK